MGASVSWPGSDSGGRRAANRSRDRLYRPSMALGHLTLTSRRSIALVVVWFQPTPDPPTNDNAPAALRSLPWEELAQDFED